jgi:hypothetical protein
VDIEKCVGREKTHSPTVVSVDSDILDEIREAYKENAFFQPVVANSNRYPTYTFHDGLSYLRDRLCIHSSAKSARGAREMLLATYHDYRDHFGIRRV